MLFHTPYIYVQRHNREYYKYYTFILLFCLPLFANVIFIFKYFSLRPVENTENFNENGGKLV